MADGGFAADHPPRPDQPFYVAPNFDGATERNTYRAQLIPVACWRVDNIRFEFDSSFVKPEIAAELSLLAVKMKAHPKAPISIFGHADPVGKDDYNKKLSGRRAIAIYAILTRNTDLWEKLYKDPDDHWGLKSVQIMLTALGYDPGPATGFGSGKTTAAVKKFQEDDGTLDHDGDPGPLTREKLFKAYMDKTCVDDTGAAFQLTNDDFLARGADPDGKGDYQGCGEFNPVLIFSNDEEKEFKKPGKTKARNEANSPNRRVVIFLFRPNSIVTPGKWPCPLATEGGEGCTKRFWSDGETRRQNTDKRREYPVTHDTFACRFYDRIAFKSPCETIAPIPLGTTDFKIWNARWEPAEGFCGDKVKLLADTDLPDGDAVQINFTPKQGSSPNLTQQDTQSSGGKIEVEWEIHDVDFKSGATFLDKVELEAKFTAAKAAPATSNLLKVKAMRDTGEETFKRDITWNGFGNHSEFKQKTDQFKTKITANFKIVKSWGATYIDFRSIGFTGRAGGAPFDGHRWGRSTGVNAQAPNEYYDGTAWQPLPAGFTITAANFQAITFHREGSNFVSPNGGTWPEEFTDYDFNSAANVAKRDAWCTETNNRWSDHFILRRSKCTSQKSTRCCVYDTQLELILTPVETFTAADHVVFVAPGNMRANAANWFLDAPNLSTAAHETGHRIDNPDEYKDGATDDTLTGDGAINGIDENCIMGQNMSKVKKRHLHAMVETHKKAIKNTFGRDYDYDTLNK